MEVVVEFVFKNLEVRICLCPDDQFQLREVGDNVGFGAAIFDDDYKKIEVCICIKRP